MKSSSKKSSQKKKTLKEKEPAFGEMSSIEYQLEQSKKAPSRREDGQQEESLNMDKMRKDDDSREVYDILNK